MLEKATSYEAAVSHLHNLNFHQKKHLTNSSTNVSLSTWNINDEAFLICPWFDSEVFNESFSLSLLCCFSMGISRGYMFHMDLLPLNHNIIFHLAKRDHISRVLPFFLVL